MAAWTFCQITLASCFVNKQSLLGQLEEENERNNWLRYTRELAIKWFVHCVRELVYEMNYYIGIVMPDFKLNCLL